MTVLKLYRDGTVSVPSWFFCVLVVTPARRGVEA
ncbi:MAG: hypothetical protein K0Q79_3210 [Flavipsychrobacter sp.]|jgi:hypothetical protein|nr:hypothetical protein [Flavipsychrobacter sp.]